MKKESLYVILLVFGCISYFIYEPVKPKDKDKTTSQASYRSGTDISGKITNNETNDPIPQANVIVSGTNVQVLSDRNGNYTIPAKKGDQLIVRRHGYRSLIVDITSNKQDIKILPLDNVFEERVKKDFPEAQLQ